MGLESRTIFSNPGNDFLEFRELTRGKARQKAYRAPPLLRLKVHLLLHVLTDRSLMWFIYQSALCRPACTSRPAYRAEMNHHCLHRPAPTHYTVVAIVPVIATSRWSWSRTTAVNASSLRDHHCSLEYSLAVISTCTYRQLCVDSLLVSTLRPWWVGGESLRRLLIPL